MKRYETRIPFFLAWKHLRHGNTWTLLLIIFLMAVAFVNLIFISSLFNGIEQGTNSQTINTTTGEIMILPKQGFDLIDNIDEITNKIKVLENIQGISDQLVLPATLTSQNYSGNWQVLAINPSQEKSVFNIHEKMIAGEYLEVDDKNGIILGIQIAGGNESDMEAFSLHGVTIGEKINFTFNGFTKEYILRGIFKTKYIDADQRAYITQASLNSTLPELVNKANSLSIKINNSDNQASVIEQTKALNLEATIYAWEEVAGLMKSITKSFVSINVLLSFVAILIAVITIFIVIYIDVSNKRQQIGILRAIGIKPYIIIFSYIIQTAIYAVAGVSLGLAIFYGILGPYFRAFPFELPIGDISLVTNPGEMIGRIETFIWISLLTSFFPVLAVTRTKILKAIWSK